MPGPQFPLYLLGREMQEIVPIAFLPEHHALAIAIMSYNGKRRLRPARRLRRDARRRRVRRHLEESLAELLEAARREGQATAKSNGSKKDGTPGTARKKTTAS